MAREDTTSSKPSSGADNISYRPTTAGDYAAPAPTTVREAHDKNAARPTSPNMTFLAIETEETF